MTSIAVTGATGFVGSHTAAYLKERGASPRLVVRDPSRAPEGFDVRGASSYGAGDEMRAALEGVETLFLIPAEESEDRVAQHRTAVAAAAAAGVSRIVYLSFVGASADNTFTLGRHHWATEEAVRATGLPHTFLRMNFYLDFVPMMVSPEGVIAGPGGDGRAALVARDDIAAVAAEVLSTGGHDGQAYDVTGGEALSFAEIAAQLSERLGRTITYKDETLEEAWASRASYGAPDWQVEAWISTYAAIAAGELERVSDTVRRLAGREPLTLRDLDLS